MNVNNDGHQHITIQAPDGGECPIGQMPTDVLDKTLRLLPYADVKAACAVCAVFRTIGVPVRDQELAKRLDSLLGSIDTYLRLEWQDISKDIPLTRIFSDPRAQEFDDKRSKLTKIRQYISLGRQDDPENAQQVFVKFYNDLPEGEQSQYNQAFLTLARPEYLEKFLEAYSKKLRDHVDCHEFEHERAEFFSR